MSKFKVGELYKLKGSYGVVRIEEYSGEDQVYPFLGRFIVYPEPELLQLRPGGGESSHDCWTEDGQFLEGVTGKYDLGVPFWESFEVALEQAAACIHQQNKDVGWYTDPKTGEPLNRNDGEMLALIHSEVSEALEGLRKNLQDDHLPHRKMVEVELADVIIRVLDYAAYRGYAVGFALAEKVEYNRNRADHKLSNRTAPGGKVF